MATRPQRGGPVKEFYARLETEIPARRLGEPREPRRSPAFWRRAAAYIRS
jgi:hypothetical protein